MKRTYYVDTPCNTFGESLVHPSNNVCYEIKSVYTGKQVHAELKDRTKADAEARRLNDAHETEMAYAAYI